MNEVKKKRHTRAEREAMQYSADMRRAGYFLNAETGSFDKATWQEASLAISFNAVTKQTVQGYAWGRSGLGYYKTDNGNYSATHLPSGAGCAQYTFKTRRQVRAYIEVVSGKFDWFLPDVEKHLTPDFWKEMRGIAHLIEATVK